MTNSITPHPLTEDQATAEATTEKATTQYLKERYKNMSDDMASLWTRAIAAEEREKETGGNKSQAEKSPELAQHIQAAHEKARQILLIQETSDSYRKAFAEENVVQFRRVERWVSEKYQNPILRPVLPKILPDLIGLNPNDKAKVKELAKKHGPAFGTLVQLHQELRTIATEMHVPFSQLDGPLALILDEGGVLDDTPHKPKK